MDHTMELKCPQEAFRLEEINIPREIAIALCGTTISVEVLPEEQPATRRVERDDYPLLIDPQGQYWNDYRPVRVAYTDAQRRVWRLPRGWLPESNGTSESLLDSCYSAAKETVVTESLNLPTEWDLWEINIPWELARRAAGKPTLVEVRLLPNQTPEVYWVYWRDPDGLRYRLPYDWRQRRIKLPGFDTLVSQGVPEHVARDKANQIVSVNYHPGSFCCLPAQYRFRDGEDNRYPVRMNDCVVIGYGDAVEHIDSISGPSQQRRL